MRSRSAVLVGLVACVVAVALITLGPLPRSGLDAFHALLLDAARLVGAPSPRRSHAEALANVLLFVPLGLGLALVRSRQPWWVLLALLGGASVLVEVVQHALPGRMPTLRDVLLNTAGGALGLWAGRLRRRARPGPAAPPSA